MQVDGTLGIRVDDPSDIIIVDASSIPDEIGDQSNPAQMRATGNKHFQAHQYKEALECYTKSLKMLEGSDKLLSVCLTNLAASLLSSGRSQAGEALAVALTAAGLP